MSGITHIDCFSGPGGICTGFHAAGLNTLVAIEFIQSCVDTYSRNHPEVHVIHSDIREVTAEQILPFIPKEGVDIVSSGMPCETFSTAGNTSRSFYDDRQFLFREGIRIAKISKAKLILFENVPAITTKTVAKDSEELIVDILKRELKEAGYENMIQVVLDASEFGVPQKRNRFFILAARDKNTVLSAPISLETPKVTVADALADIPNVVPNSGIEQKDYLDIKFTVNDNKIRFGLGSVKNVGTSAVETIVQEREKNGEFKSFTDFAERMQGEAVNKKCIESLIKSGAFDELGETRHTLLNSFEGVLDTISGETKKSIEGQVTMFDIASQETTEKHKYTLNKAEEYDERELLDMEKEMLGIYISGHPLAKLQEKIKANTNINTLQMISMKEEKDFSKDGKPVKYAGIITSVKKKYTKNNTIMAFVTVEDLYGSTEIIVFDSCYNRSSSILLEDNIVLVDGRLSIREDDDVKIVANSITDFETVAKQAQETETVMKQEQRPKALILDIQNASEEQKSRLRGAIRFFMGDRNNIAVKVQDKEGLKPCGAIYLNEEILKEFKEILGEENVKI